MPKITETDGKGYFCDEEFPATNESLYPHGDGPTYTWKRPWELADDPVMFNGGPSRRNVLQGNMNDCWLLAACAGISQSEHIEKKYRKGDDRKEWLLTSCLEKERLSDMLKQVIPEDQILQEGSKYTGKVTFRLWKMGKWVTVEIDDRLPVDEDDALVCARGECAWEFFAPLIEKAFAKLIGKYYLLNGGYLEAGLQTLTGALVMVMETKEETLFSTLRDEFGRGSIIVCGSSVLDKHTISEMQRPQPHDVDGVVCQHAYTITGLASIRSGERKVKLVRVWNPWGSVEWIGSWSDSDSIWDNLDEDIKNSMFESRDKEDGESWISLTDFITYFREVSFAASIFCPGLSENGKTEGMQASAIHGWWTDGIPAGCQEENLARNPQYLLRVEERDDVLWENAGKPEPETCTVWIEVMRDEIETHDNIGSAIYETNSKHRNLTAKEMMREHGLINSSNRNSVLQRIQLKPGYYVIVPFREENGESLRFLLRAYSKKKIKLTEFPKYQEKNWCQRLYSTFIEYLEGYFS